MTLLTALTVEDSRILAGIYFIFLKRVLEYQTFQYQIEALWKDEECSYQVRQILALYFNDYLL